MYVPSKSKITYLITCLMVRGWDTISLEFFFSEKLFHLDIRPNREEKSMTTSFSC